MSDLDVRAFALGPLQTNCYLVRASSQATDAILVDPGEEPQRLQQALDAIGAQVKAIMVTHCHFDHIGAVAAMARSTNAPVYCPQIEQPVLGAIERFTPPGFGPFESWQADLLPAGGELYEIAGLKIEVLATPGHSPGHLTYAVSPAMPSTGPQADGAGTDVVSPATERKPLRALFSGDVLFQQSVGRVDLPGGDWSVLERSIESLCERYSGDSPVYPGHMGITTLARELADNPFLSDIAMRMRTGTSQARSTAASAPPSTGS